MCFGILLEIFVYEVDSHGLAVHCSVLCVDGKKEDGKSTIILYVDVLNLYLSSPGLISSINIRRYNVHVVTFVITSQLACFELNN